MSSPGVRLIRVRETCDHCGRLHVGVSRQGLFFKCQHCGRRNVGPALKREYTTAPPPERPRRAAAAVIGGGAPPPEAPRQRLSALRVLTGGRR